MTLKVGQSHAPSKVIDVSMGVAFVVHEWMFKTCRAPASSTQPSWRALAIPCPSSGSPLTFPVNNQEAQWQMSMKDRTDQGDEFSVLFKEGSWNLGPQWQRKGSADVCAIGVEAGRETLLNQWRPSIFSAGSLTCAKVTHHQTHSGLTCKHP